MQDLDVLIADVSAKRKIAREARQAEQVAKEAREAAYTDLHLADEALNAEIENRMNTAKLD